MTKIFAYTIPYAAYRLVMEQATGPVASKEDHPCFYGCLICLERKTKKSKGGGTMSRNDRYAVYASDRSPELREIVGDDPHYTVWDRELMRSVPFGGYGSVDSAQRRAYRMNHPTGWDTGSQRLCVKCADAYMTGGGNRTGWLPVQGTVNQTCAWCGVSMRRTDQRVKSCGVFGDHGPHTLHGTDVRCPGNGPFMDTELAKLEPETYPGPPCVCTDSVWSNVGHCPPSGDREFGRCPVRSGRLKRNGDA